MTVAEAQSKTTVKNLPGRAPVDAIEKVEYEMLVAFGLQLRGASRNRTISRPTPPTED